MRCPKKSKQKGDNAQGLMEIFLTLFDSLAKRIDGNETLMRKKMQMVNCIEFEKSRPLSSYTKKARDSSYSSSSRLHSKKDEHISLIGN